MFYQLFEVVNQGEEVNYYKFFYFRTSPRGNSKFGVCDVPWQRLRMQQQGTDEEIQFDHLYLLKSKWPYSIPEIEKQLIDHYKDRCLAESNQRAGHTEWFKQIDHKDFEKRLKEAVENCDAEICKVKSKKPYSATKRSQCPLYAPNTYDESWCKQFWKQIA